MIIIGFETMDGNPVIKTSEEKQEFLRQSGFKEGEVKFADDDITIPTMMKGIAESLKLNKHEKTCNHSENLIDTTNTRCRRY